MRPTALPLPERVSLPKHCQSPGQPTVQPRALHQAAPAPPARVHHLPVKRQERSGGLPSSPPAGLPHGVGFGEKTGLDAGGGESVPRPQPGTPRGSCSTQHHHCHHQSSVACTLSPRPAGGGRALAAGRPALSGSHMGGGPRPPSCWGLPCTERNPTAGLCLFAPFTTSKETPPAVA